MLNDLAEQVMEAARVGFEAAISKTRADATEPTMQELMAAGVAGALGEIPEGFLSLAELASVILASNPAGQLRGQTQASLYLAKKENSDGLGQ